MRNGLKYMTSALAAGAVTLTITAAPAAMADSAPAAVIASAPTAMADGHIVQARFGGDPHGGGYGWPGDWPWGWRR